jgi:hypothetical protein
MVEEQAFPLARFDAHLFGRAVAHHLERPARFNRRQNADQALFDAIRRTDLARDVFFADGA